MLKREQEFELWLDKNYPDVDPTTRKMLYEAFEYGYFSGWTEGENHATY